MQGGEGEASEADIQTYAIKLVCDELPPLSGESLGLSVPSRPQEEACAGNEQKGQETAHHRSGKLHQWADPYDAKLHL
jgi:hypothetical protein